MALGMAGLLKITSFTQQSQIGRAAVRLFAFGVGDLGSTARSDYKRVALVVQNVCGWGYMSLAAYKYSLPRSLRIKPNKPNQTIPHHTMD